jgi:hypothetical protein
MPGALETLCELAAAGRIHDGSHLADSAYDELLALMGSDPEALELATMGRYCAALVGAYIAHPTPSRLAAAVNLSSLLASRVGWALERLRQSLEAEFGSLDDGDPEATH